MNIAITEVSGLKEAILAAGIKTLLEAVEIPVNVRQDGVVPAAPAAASIVADVPAEPLTRASRIPSKKAKSVVKQLAPPPAKSEPASGPSPTVGNLPDPRGSIRDAVRRALSTSGKDIITMVQAVQRTFPEKNRDYIGTVLCQLAKGGECELGDDGKWRKGA